MMKLFRYLPENSTSDQPRIGAVLDDKTLDLTSIGVQSLTTLFESETPISDSIASLRLNEAADVPASFRFLPPTENQPVWAAGVTYIRSKVARMDESDFSASAYDRVYDADRPEIFFKSAPESVVPHNDPVGIRKDATWSVPEPELTLIMNSRGAIVGYSIGNDMSSRDIEGENLLYLPQAKTYDRSCAIGPYIVPSIDTEDPRTWQIELKIDRDGSEVFQGSVSVYQLKRSFSELRDYLFRSQRFPHGAALLTGTGIVPPDHFSLNPGDRVSIAISGIGTLSNQVIEV